MTMRLPARAVTFSCNFTQARQQWLQVLTGGDGRFIAHLIFVVNNSLSDDLIEAR